MGLYKIPASRRMIPIAHIWSKTIIVSTVPGLQEKRKQDVKIRNHYFNMV